MREEKKSFWARLFGGSRNSLREQKVLEYIVHGMNQGANLKDVVGEEYVRRNLSRSQINNILSDPRIIEAARKRMQEALRSRELDVDERPRGRTA